LTSLGVTLSGVFAYYSVVESNILRVPSLLFILNGYLLSFLLREKKHRRLYASLFSSVLLLLLIIDVIKGNGLLLLPPEVRGEPGLVVGSFLLWLVVLRSFALFSIGYLLFSIIPAVAFLGLLSAYSVEPDLYLYTALCFLFSILLLSFSTYDIGKLSSLRSSLFLLGLVIFLLAVPFAVFLLYPLQTLSSAIPVPRVYVRLGSLFRQELVSSFPFLSNTLSLGGGLPRGEEVILEIKGNGPSLLRASTYDYFSGRYWVKTLSNFTTLRGKGERFLISPLNASKPKTRLEIYPKNEGSLALPPAPAGFPGAFFFTGRRTNLLTPPHPCEIKFNSGVVPAYLIKGIDNTLAAVFFDRGDISSYEVIAQPDIAWQESSLSSIYLQKPPSSQVAALAKEITSSYESDYQKAMAIQSYLQSNFSYSLSGTPPPEDNGVEWFLFKNKKGDCDFFASAMCILLREVGIPARVAIGYSVSEYDAERKVWLVREKDAHMWVEAYIKGDGWMTFDPTPAGGSGFQEFLLSLQRYYLLHRRQMVPLVLFLFSFALLLMLLRISWKEVRKDKKDKKSEEKLVVYYLSLCKKLAKMGLPNRESHNTLREWLQMVSPFLTPPFLASLEEITNLCEEVCYNKAVSEERIERAIERIKEMRRVRKWQIVKTSIS